MSRSDRMYIEDILDACLKIQRYTDGMSRSEFEEDHKTYDAVVRNLEIIGEAAKHVPEKVRDELNNMEWRKITGFRDMLAHAYFGIDNDILWDVLTTKISEVREMTERYLTSLRESPDS